MANSAYNKTIDLTIEEGKSYLKKCVTFSSAKNWIDCVDKTILGDTFELLKNIPGKPFVDLAIVDPPYNLSKDFGKMKFAKMSELDYESYTHKWVELLLPFLKPYATVYVCCDWHCSSIIEKVLSEYLTIQNRITWARNKGRGTKTNWKNDMEDIWFATMNPHNYTFNVDAVKVKRKVLAPYRVDGNPKDWIETEEGNYRMTSPSNIWTDLVTPFWSMKENTAHPTQKSEKLLAKLILASSNQGDIVFDPFAGSGSTLVTAKKLDRHYLGIELNEQYAVWIEKRLEMADTDKTIQGYNGVFEK